MKILINVPNLSLLGGVSSHYRGLKSYWHEDVRYNTVGKRGKRNGSGLYWLPWDVVKFIFRLLIFRPDIVLVNPSLGMNSLRRDFIFTKIALLFRFKVVCFLHGFNWNIVTKIDHSWVKNNLNKTSMLFVLAHSIKEELRTWGVSIPIILSSTKIEDRMIDDFDISTRRGKVDNILFLSRLEKEKGLYEAINSYALLKLRYPHIRLTIVGNGSEWEAAQRYVAEKRIKEIYFLGELRGNTLIEAFKDADLYIFPSYGEGMPTSVLEAMAFGLPIITRNVGGLVDFFENGKMGVITDSFEPSVFAQEICRYLDDPELTRNTSQYNSNYAREHFLATFVAKSIEQHLMNIL